MASPAPAAGAVDAASGGLTDPLLASANGHGAAAKKAGHGAKGKYWVASDKAERRAAKESGGEDGRPLLFRRYKVKGALLQPLQVSQLSYFLMTMACIGIRAAAVGAHRHSRPRQLSRREK
jgi:hypothetical protein